MRPMDKVIGYKNIKEELYRLIDVLKNPSKYQKMGIEEPKGLMLIGVPGIGKSLLAECIIEESGRKSFIIRKTRSDGDFINFIQNTFEEAKKSAPSIILIDDMDRFENSDMDKVNGEAYIAIQSLIDEIKNYKVYVIATVNNEYLLPDSLCRDGRFDKKIYMRVPDGDNAIKIVSHYLKNYPCANDVNSEFISKILDNESCATLKNVINEAGIRAAYNNKDKIDMDDILHACLRVIYKAPECLENANYDYVRNIAYHEAGHAVIKEVLEPGTVNIVTVLKCEGDIGGITSSSQDKNYYNDIDFMDNKVLTLLGGKAAIELKYGKIDTGCTSDIDRAFNIVERTTKDFAGYSFMCHDELSLDDNWAKKNKQRIMAFKMEEYYSKAKRILVENNGLLEKMADLLVKKKIITYLDIQALKNDLG